MQDQTTTGANNQKAFAFILITMAVDGVGAGIILPALPLLLVELIGNNIARAAIYGGWLTTVFSIAQFFAAPLLGNLSDRYGRRPVLLGSLAAFGINYLIIALAPTVSWLFVGALLSGVFGARLSAANAYVADVTPPSDRTRRFGMTMATLGAGFILGPLLVGLLGHYNTRAPFYIAAVLALLNFVYGLIVLPESLHAENRNSFSIKRATPIGTFAEMHGQAQVLWLVGALGLMQVAIMTIPVIWGYFSMLKYGWSQSEVGMSLSLYATATVIVQGMLVGRINARLGNQRTVCLGFACTIISLLGYAFASDSWLMLAFIVPSALGSITGAALISHMSHQMSASSQGQLQGAVAGTRSAASILTPLLMTQLFSYFSTKDAALYFPGAPYLAAALFAGAGLLLALHAFRREAMINGGITIGL